MSKLEEHIARTQREMDAADRQMTTTMGRLIDNGLVPRGAEAIEQTTPLSALLAKEREAEGWLVTEGGAEVTLHEVRIETITRMLVWIFERGVDPRLSCQRLYTLTKEVAPHLICNLSLEQLGLLLGETRANGSARALLIFRGLKAAAGLTSDFGSAHKSSSARAKMRDSARGNKNRSKAAKPAAAA